MSKEKNTDASLARSFVKNNETFELWKHGERQEERYTLYVVDDPESFDMPWVVKKYTHKPTDEEMAEDAKTYQKNNTKGGNG